jgi:hypothetical protein
MNESNCILLASLKKVLVDKSAYVRKIASNALLKLSFSEEADK